MILVNRRVFEFFMGDSSEEKIRKLAIIFAVVGFFVHILLWALYRTEKIAITGDASELVNSPLSALYTPFSILLVLSLIHI